MIVGRDGERVVLRLPEGMGEALSHVAGTTGRSRNSEIVLRLAESIGFGLEPKTRIKRKRK